MTSQKSKAVRRAKAPLIRRRDPAGVFSPGTSRARISQASTLREALAAINESGTLLSCLEDDAGRLVAILTDSDVRRALLAGASLEEAALRWANRAPLTASADATPVQLQRLAARTAKRELPLLDAYGRVCDIFLLGKTRAREAPPRHKVPSTRAPLPNTMFILAGGEGRRLRPSIGDLPKPLATVGGKPLVERLVYQGVRSGIERFIVATHHQAPLVERHFRSAAYKNLTISFVRERSPLGTAGAIGLIAARVQTPLLVCNADLLTDVPFERLLAAHEDEGAEITCGVRAGQLQIPFGVVSIDRGSIVSVDEKPVHSFLANAGIYVLSPSACRRILRNVRCDMTDVIRSTIEAGGRVVPFMLHEYWRDVGRPEDYIQANHDFAVQGKGEGR